MLELRWRVEGPAEVAELEGGAWGSFISTSSRTGTSVVIFLKRSDRNGAEPGWPEDGRIWR